MRGLQLAIESNRNPSRPAMETREKALVLCFPSAVWSPATFDITYACTFWFLKRGVAPPASAVRRFRLARRRQFHRRGAHGAPWPRAPLLHRHVDGGDVLPVRAALVGAVAKTVGVRSAVRCAALRDHELHRRPLSAANPGSRDLVWVLLSIAVHAFLIGTPCALFGTPRDDRGASKRLAVGVCCAAGMTSIHLPPCQRCGANSPGGVLLSALRHGSPCTGRVWPTLATPTGAPVEVRPDAAEAQLAALRRATMGQYEILVEIGRGGMATVYLAHDIGSTQGRHQGARAALLLMGEGMVERFKREARTAAALSHPHIIPIYAVRDSEHVLYFVMKHVQGRSVDHVIRDVGPLPGSDDAGHPRTGRRRISVTRTAMA